MIYFDLDDDQGPMARWVALWLDRYLHLKQEAEGDGCGVYPFDRIGPGAPWMVVHEVGRRLAHGQLVLQTVNAARAEGRPPLVVITRHRSPNRVALVPIEVRS